MCRFNCAGGATVDRRPRTRHIWSSGTPPGRTGPVECRKCSRRASGKCGQDLIETWCLSGRCPRCVNPHQHQSLARLRWSWAQPTASWPAWPPCRRDSSTRTETLRRWRYNTLCEMRTVTPVIMGSTKQMLALLTSTRPGRAPAKAAQAASRQKLAARCLFQFPTTFHYGVSI